MWKYRFLIIVFLIAVMSISFSSLFDFNVQILYRIPFINIRWIDLVILTIMFSYLFNAQFAKEILRNNKLIIQLCLIFILFETFQLLRSWHVADLDYQISKFLCILSIAIILDLSTYKIDKDQIIAFLRYLVIAGSVVLIITNTITFFAFISGRVIFTDSDIRIGLNAEGIKEVVSAEGLKAFVYAFGLYIIQNEGRLWEKLVIAVALISIFLALVFSFSRGYLFTLTSITFIHLIVFSKNVSKAFITLFSLIILIGVFYIIFGSNLRQKGYDPIEKVTQIAQFAIDKDNPEWDKGRSLSRRYALDAWEKNIWLGVGYDELSNYGLPEGWATAHSFVITSLFHRGIIGTLFYLLIIFLLYVNGIKYWIRTKRVRTYQSDMIKILIIVSFFWLVGFLTQELIWEKYSLSLQFMFLGLVSNFYKQKID